MDFKSEVEVDVLYQLYSENAPYRFTWMKDPFNSDIIRIYDPEIVNNAFREEMKQVPAGFLPPHLDFGLVCILDKKLHRIMLNKLLLNKEIERRLLVEVFFLVVKNIGDYPDDIALKLIDAVKSYTKMILDSGQYRPA